MMFYFLPQLGGGGNSNILFMFTPNLGENDPNLTSIMFQLGW